MSLFPKKVEYPFKPTTDTEPELLPIKEPEPAAMSRYEVLAVSTPTGMTMLMTFCAGSLLSY